MQYINMDEKLLKNGGRVSVRLTKEEFLEKIYNTSIKSEDFEYEGTLENFTEEDINGWILVENSTIKKDISKIKFYNDNLYWHKDDMFTPTLLGLNTLDNGFTFLGFMAGGDWEVLLFFIIYFDGKKLRGYIPSYGNCINLDFKTALGSEEEEENTDDFIEKQLKKDKYSNVIGIGSQPFVFYENISELYCEDQGVELEEIDINWEAVKKDIESRISSN